jgi:hypothetical protein
VSALYFAGWPRHSHCSVSDVAKRSVRAAPNQAAGEDACALASAMSPSERALSAIVARTVMRATHVGANGGRRPLGACHAPLRAIAAPGSQPLHHPRSKVRQLRRKFEAAPFVARTDMTRGVLPLDGNAYIRVRAGKRL